MKINWDVRLANPVFLANIVLAVVLPILAYFGLEWDDITSWPALLNILIDAVQNPVVVVAVIVSVWNAINDPTTKGLSDSTMALQYRKPR